MAPEYFLLTSLKPSVLRPVPFFKKKKDLPALNELVQADISTLKRLAAFIGPIQNIDMKAILR